MRALLLALFVAQFASAQCDAAPPASDVRCPAPCVSKGEFVNFCGEVNACGSTPCPPQCPPGPTGSQGPIGPAGPAGAPGVCPTCPPSGGGGTATGTGFEVRDRGRLTAEMDESGLLVQGRSCEPMVRGMAVRPGQQLCGDNGDIYEWTGTTGTCQLGTIRSLGQPFAWEPEIDVPVGGTVYPGWAASDNFGWQYGAASTTSAASCRMGAKATWCSTAGCVVTNGTCRLTARTIAPAQFVDGTCQLRNVYTDVPRGEAAVKLGPRFPLGTAYLGFGDNAHGRPLAIGRGAYGGPDDPTVGIGGWGDMRDLAAGTALRASPQPGFSVRSGPSIGVATTPPLVLTPIAGGSPSSLWLCAQPAWQNSLGTGPTPVGRARCAPATNGIVRVSMPNRDGWVWPVAFPRGRTMLRVYYTWLTNPCTPPAGQTTCLLADEPNERLFTVFGDYMISPTDSWDKNVASGMEEYESPKELNETGVPMLQVYDTASGFAVPINLATMAGTPASVPGGFVFPANDNGFIYTLYGKNCTNCGSATLSPRCDRRRGGQTTLGQLTASQLRTDILLFCDTNNNAWQRSMPIGFANVYTEALDLHPLYGRSCPLGFKRPKPYGQEGEWFYAGLCDGRFEWYGPNGPSEVLFSCGADGCRPGPTRSTGSGSVAPWDDPPLP